MRILFLCGREPAYPLNQFLIDSARRFAVVDVLVERGQRQSILWRSLRVSLQAVPRMLFGKYDLILVSFFGHFLMLPVRLFRRAPVLFHPFISTHETLVDDRETLKARSIPARLAFWLDRYAVQQADHILLDTQANIDFFSRQFDVPPERFTRILIGSNEDQFYPRSKKISGDRVVVIFHGSYLPLHGIDVIIQAAGVLNAREDIVFRMVGKGMGYERITALARDMGLRNIEFLDPVPLADLPDLIAGADICLGGHFGTSDKALRVIAGKTFQDIAMGKPTIVGDTPANHELLTHGVDSWFVPPSDHEALADAIKTLADDPSLRARIGESAAKTFQVRASMKVLAPELKRLLEKLVNRPEG